MYAELVDFKNLLKTGPSAAEPEQSTLVAGLGKGVKRGQLRVIRLFSLESPKNSTHCYDL